MSIHPWQEVEIVLTATQKYANSYTDVDVQVDFIHENGTSLRRPAFWDGGQTWKVRFASPLTEGEWNWRSQSSNVDSGLQGQSDSFDCGPNPEVTHRFYRHGFWRMSSGKRSLVHADGYPAILAADTAWGIPWRATEEQCQVYAQDRHRKGFNAVMLMSVQPDMRAQGPRDRSIDEGFDVGFEDLPNGHINELNPAYFQYLDRLIGILLENEIVPIFQPVFFGFGWKGLDVAGPVLPPADYARYCRYLVARYGARPAIYLVGGDGSGYEPQVPVGGEEIQKWDAYEQPTGIHYRPHADNCAWQSSEWLDFQWCQTGHIGEHIPERVAEMWRNTPIKAVANGEPSYENTGETGRAAGWWQGHEAWSNLCAGGTMGVFYGAGSLWQWSLRANELGQSAYFLAPGASWREALDFEGSNYVGLVPRILEGLPTTDMTPNWQVTLGRRGLLVPSVLFIAYKENGGGLEIVANNEVPLPYRIIDPRNGQILKQGVRASASEWIQDEGGSPRVYICYSGWQ